MDIKHPSRILFASLFLGWCFDILFWKSLPGINYFIFVILNLLLGFILIYGEHQKPGMMSYALVIPIILFSGLVFVRQEPLSTFINIIASLVLLMLLALTFLNGNWTRFSFSDMVVHPFHLLIEMLKGGAALLSQPGKLYRDEAANKPEVEKKGRFWAIVRGLLLASPIVFVITLLLTSADPIFSKELNDFLNLDHWTEYALRVIYILILAYLLTGIFSYAITRSKETRLLGIDKPWLSPFLGLVESVIILGSINLLFILFVSVQFRYFFGGQSNIQLDGYTYAEYARKGFSELVIVAFLSLMIFLILSTVTRRLNSPGKKLFSGLGIGMVFLITVILISAYQRLLLYESAYGFSRLRTYTHIFMIWIGLLLFAMVVLEITNRQRAFAFATLLTCLGFGLTLNFLNIDGFIVERNIARAEAGAELDANYLYQLSNDAIPVMFRAYNTTNNPTIRNKLGAILACWKTVKFSEQPVKDWRAYSWSESHAFSLFVTYEQQLIPYSVKPGNDGDTLVRVNGIEVSCNSIQ